MNLQDNPQISTVKNRNISDYLVSTFNTIIGIFNWKYLPRCIAVLVALIGITVLLGWAFSIPILKITITDSISMKANTSIGFIFASIALFLIEIRISKIQAFLILVLAIFVTTLGLASISQNIFNIELGIDQMFFPDQKDQYTTYPGRLAPFTSIAFIFLGLSLLAIRFNFWQKPVRIITMALIIINSLILLGYLWNANQLIDFKLSTPVSFKTAICIALMGIGLFLVSFEKEKPRFIITAIEIKILTSFAFSFILLLIGSGYTYKTISEYTVSMRGVVQSQETSSLLSKIYSSILDMESLQRSYISTGKENFKKDYSNGVAAVNENCKKLESLFNNNPDQLKNAIKLKMLLVDKIEILNKQIEGFEERKNNSPNSPDELQNEIQQVKNIRNQVNLMSEKENELLLIREKTLLSYRDNTLIAILLTLTLAILLYVIIFKAIREEIIARAHAETLMNQEKENAEQANRAKNSFLAIMSHEIRTPLTGMLGMLELLSMTPLEDDQNNTLNTAWDSGRSLLRIVSDILDWSKIEEGKLELSPSATSINQLLQEVVNTYSRVASAKDLVLWQHTDTRISESLEVDSLRLSQVLNNFVSNAIKFTKSGEIEVRAELHSKSEGKERIKFSVKDTGIGIDKANQQQLFQFYRQARADTARLYGGTGLGLAICKRLTELMDGKIELISELGEGSTFSITLTLPISKNPLEAIRKLAPDVRQRAITPLFENKLNAPLVLAVDDHPTNREMLSRQLSLLGLNVETAENGNEALKLWRTGRFSLIISDCHMPELNGYELSKLIRKIEEDEKTQHTIIIAWTANALKEEKVKCQEAGMDDLLTKPVDLETLKRMIAKSLGILTISSQAQNQIQRKGPFNFSVLSKTILEPEKQTEVLIYFSKHIRNDYDILIDSIEKSDLIKIENTSHRMKGSSMMVGANDLAFICEKIEKQSNEKNLQGSKDEMIRLQEAIIQVEKYCNNLILPKNKV